MEELRKYIDIYNEKFSEDFAGFYFKGLSPKEIIEIIKECIEKNKDIYELGFVEIDIDSDF